MLEKWSNEARHLEPDERYEHPSFENFAAGCASRRWTSSNETELAKKRHADATRRRKARALEKRNARRRRPATAEFLSALEVGYARRLQALSEAARDPASGQWLKKLDDRSILLTCDIWRMDELLSWELRKRATGGEIARRLILAGQNQGRKEHSMRSRVSDARQRISRLEDEMAGLAAWRPFQPESRVDTPCKQTVSARDIYVFIEEDLDGYRSNSPRAM